MIMEVAVLVEAAVAVVSEYKLYSWKASRALRRVEW